MKLLRRKPLLYFVTPNIGNDVHKWATMIFEAVEGGVTAVQLRDKQVDVKEIIAAARFIHPFLKQKRVLLIINDHVDAAFAVDADGVHLGQSDFSVGEARELLGDEALIGLSVEKIENLKREEEDMPNYIAASPVFETMTKLNCAPPWGLEGLRKLCASTKLPVVAIGGINADNIADVIRNGACGAAVVSAISHAADPRQASAELIERMKEA